MREHAGSTRKDTFEPGARDRYAEARAHSGSLTAMLDITARCASGRARRRFRRRR